jgi:serine/threonine-protein kinase/endoribonuclease IRE1
VKISNYCFDELQLNNSIKSIPWISFRAVENLRNGETFIPNEKDYVFSLGCVSYFILTRGKSLFKNGIERLLKNVEPNLVVGLLSDNLNYLEFLKGMIKRQEDGEDGRLSISGVLKHPIFWEPSRKLEYFVNIKNNILLDDEDFKKYASNFFTKKKNALSKLENEKHQLFELNWMTKLPHQIQLYESTKKRHKVTDSHKKSVEGLIKYIRNKEAHWGELPEFVKNELGSTKEGFIELLLGPKHFPNLLILTYNCMKTLKIEGNLVSYYD